MQQKQYVHIAFVRHLGVNEFADLDDCILYFRLLLSAKT